MSDTSRCPVVLVHGILDSAKDMAAIAQVLRDNGYDTRSISLTPNDGSVPLDTSARQLDDFVRRELAGSRINLVAFSMGGLVSLLWLMNYGGLAQTRHYVPISAPLHGTLSAYLMNRPGIVDMRPDSSLVQELISREHELRHIQVTTIATRLDGIVLPYRTSSLSVAEPFNHKLWVPLHRLMLFERRVHELILEALQRD